MVKKHIKQIIEITIPFALLGVVAGFLSIFSKPSITGAVVLNNNLDPGSAPLIVTYLLIALAFFVVYALYLNIKKKK